MEEEAASPKRDESQDNVVTLRQPTRSDETTSEDEWAWLDVRFSHVTAEALEAAMIEEKFPLRIAASRDASWLAMAVRRSVAISAIREVEASPRDRRSNVEVRDNLASLAGRALALYRDLWSLPDEDAAAIDELLFAEDMGESPFNSSRERLLELYQILRTTSNAAAADIQPPRWRQAEERRQRIELGRHLAPVFEAAFRQAATASDHQHGTVRKPSDFVAFYEIISKLTEVPGRAHDLAGVTKAAVQKHHTDPVQFEPGVIPGL